MRKRIFRSMCAAALLGVLLTCLCVTGVLYRSAFNNMKQSIRDEAVYLAASLNQGDESGLAATTHTFTRVTVVDPDGAVVYDSVENPGTMENHLNRPEIEAALRTGASETQRLSETLATQTYYRAVRLQSGQVVRVSGSMNSLWASVLGSVPLLTLISVAVVILSGVAAHYQTKRIAAPVNEIDLDNPLSGDVYEELSPLLRRMEQQRLKIEEQMGEMASQQKQFASITSHMREGLILLGDDAQVLSINRSALLALGVSEADCLNKHILHMNRSEAFQAAVARGLSGTPEERILPMNGRQYQLLASPVVGEEGIGGTVLLLLDVTDKRDAEKMRREFTANVSHELKTPLTSISGYAEIMKNGMVKTEDIPQFSQRIYNEARRLIALVEDIIRLSRLDEGGTRTAEEPVELLALAQEVADRFTAQAGEKGVTLTVTGQPASVKGVRQILEEMISNLCDNAIKYNKEGGTVDIRLSHSGGDTVLTVTDSGIGIPKEHQTRVFERFYRVDKSHSKETGGTGLGLSIVKHAAAYHGAKLELASEEDRGTEIKITFNEQTQS